MEDTFNIPSFDTDLTGNSAAGHEVKVGQGAQAAPMRDRDGASEGHIAPFQK